MIQVLHPPRSFAGPERVKTKIAAAWSTAGESLTASITGDDEDDPTADAASEWDVFMLP